MPKTTLQVPSVFVTLPSGTPSSRTTIQKGLGSWCHVATRTAVPTPTQPLHGSVRASAISVRETPRDPPIPYLFTYLTPIGNSVIPVSDIPSSRSRSTFEW